MDLSPDDSGVGTDFERWREQSESELRQRLEIDRQLLASELHLLKLQASWLKPYLHQIQKSESKENPALVNAFNTALFELVLLVELPSDIELAVQQGDLPKMLLGKQHRRPRPLLIVELRFRAVPERTTAGSYAYRGRAELTFTSYALNDDELAVLRREMERNEFGELFSMLEQKTPDTVHRLLSDLGELFRGNFQPKEAKPATEDVNPFSTLFSIGEWFKSSPEKTNDIHEPIQLDSDVEQVLRSVTLLEARSACRELYEYENVYGRCRYHVETCLHSICKLRC